MAFCLWDFVSETFDLCSINQQVTTVQIFILQFFIHKVASKWYTPFNYANHFYWKDKLISATHVTNKIYEPFGKFYNDTYSEVTKSLQNYKLEIGQSIKNSIVIIIEWK